MEEATARKKLKADKAAALVAKKKGNELYSAKVTQGLFAFFSLSLGSAKMWFPNF